MQVTDTSSGFVPLHAVVALIKQIRGLSPLILGLAVWQVSPWQSATTFPRPSSWWTAARQLLAHGQLVSNLGSTGETFGMSLIISATAGLALGLLIGSNRGVWVAVSPLVELLRVLPMITVIPIGALVLGYTSEMKVAIVSFGGFWPVLIAVIAARRAVSQDLMDLASLIGMPRLRQFRTLTVPIILPEFLSALAIAAPLVLILTIAVELLTGLKGLGAMLANAESSLRAADVFALVTVAGLVGWLLNIGITSIHRAVLHGRGLG